MLKESLKPELFKLKIQKIKLILALLRVCLTEHKIPHISLPDEFIAENINLVVKGICDKCNGQYLHFRCKFIK